MKDNAKKIMEQIRKVGRGPAVEGVYPLTRDGVVTSDHDGNPIAPNDPLWNSPEQIEERRRSKQK